MNAQWQISLARRWLPPMLVAVILAGALAFFVSTLQPSVYEAEATLIVGTSLSGSPDYNELLVSEQLAQTYATVATTRPILEGVQARLELDESLSALRERFSAQAVPDSTLLTIRARDSDPERAAVLANALVDELISASPAGDDPLTDVPQAVDTQLTFIQEQMESAQERLAELTAVEELSEDQQAELQEVDETLRNLRETYATLIPFSTGNAPNLLTVVDPAVVPQTPTSPRPSINAMVGGMAAALVVATIAFMVEFPSRARRPG